MVGEWREATITVAVSPAELFLRFDKAAYQELKTALEAVGAETKPATGVGAGDEAMLRTRRGWRRVQVLVGDPGDTELFVQASDTGKSAIIAASILCELPSHLWTTMVAATAVKACLFNVDDRTLTEDKVESWLADFPIGSRVSVRQIGPRLRDGRLRVDLRHIDD